MHALNLISRTYILLHCHAVEILSFLDLLKIYWNVELIHTLREGNQGADMFTKLGSCGHEKLYIWHDRPPSLISILKSDTRFST